MRVRAYSRKMNESRKNPMVRPVALAAALSLSACATLPRDAELRASQAREVYTLSEDERVPAYIRSGAVGGRSITIREDGMLYEISSWENEGVPVLSIQACREDREERGNVSGCMMRDGYSVSDIGIDGVADGASIRTGYGTGASTQLFYRGNPDWHARGWQTLYNRQLDAITRYRDRVYNPRTDL